ncbi:MAG: transporter substrate-binding domain-containing protein [Lentimicrobiaceae bacterium]|nr:transporter substrate-binding domain-containing protein [Lentimicrobiaceae bacterium]
MKKLRHLPYGFVVLMLLLFSLIACRSKEKKEMLTDAESRFVIQKIKAKGKIVASTDFNSINYFIYKGEPLGYQYELLKSFSDYLGVELEIIVNNDINKAFECLNNGFCDIVAMDLTQTYSRSKKYDFSVPILQARQVLVQKKPLKGAKWQCVRNPLQLGGATIIVQKGSVYADRVRNLQEEIGDSITLIEDPTSTVEELAFLVSKGKIKYTICDEHVAKVYQRNYPNLDIQTAVSFPQNMGWAVQKGSTHLRHAMNDWLTQYKTTRQYKLTYNKYFQQSKASGFAHSEYENISKGIISPYDKIIRKHSREIGWDWRLLASLIYQESAFQPDAVSSNGAFGLMQLMPQTARKYRVSQYSHPDGNIKAGVKYLVLIEKQFEDIPDKDERIKFVLAAYNVGIGHVMDARRLALKYKKDPDMWSNNVDGYMLQKSNPKYYNDSVVLFGYCPGKITYNFVNEIYDRYYHYKNITDK